VEPLAQQELVLQVQRERRVHRVRMEDQLGQEDQLVQRVPKALRVHLEDQLVHRDYMVLKALLVPKGPRVPREEQVLVD